MRGFQTLCVKHIAHESIEEEVDGPESDVGVPEEDVSTSFISENRMWEDISY